MITIEEYQTYFGEEAPSNFDRLLQIALTELRAIMVQNVPTTSPLEDIFKKALLEEIGFLDTNSDLLDSNGNGYTLGSYKEGNSNNSSTNSINRVSPVAYDMLLVAGLLYEGV